MDFFHEPPPAAEPEHGPEPEQLPEHEPHTRRRSHRLLVPLMAAAIAIAAIAGYSATTAYESESSSVSTTSASATTPSTAAAGSAASSSSSTAGSTKLTLAQIEAAVDPALVDITSTLGSSGTAEGTGMVISSTGEILTNNHVISGATSISVKIGGTGTVYSASVVGYDVSHDVAVLQIANVSGLKTVSTAAASSIQENDAVVVVGNALGKGGTPVAVEGVVTTLNQTITASDETGSLQETLNGLIQLSAAVEPGDSGGATVNAYGQVIGMTTAASSTGYHPMSTASGTTATTAYAIPIDSALKIAAQIEAGTANTTVHIGEHGLLGVEVQSATGAFGGSGSGGVAVAGVQSGSAAAAAGLTGGDTITTVNRRSISSISDLNDTMAATHIGDKLTIGWQDSSGQSHQATVTLTTGAA